MKYFLTALWVFVCIGVLAFSHITWNKQTTVQAVVSDTEPSVKQDTNGVNADDKYMALAANLPEAAKKQLKLSLKDGKPYSILFVGSTALQWGSQVTESLLKSYGSERITTEMHTYDLTSNDFIGENKQLELAAKKAQLIVIEPFLLNDNGEVTIENTLANLTKIMEDIKAESPDTTFILQPSNPIYLPKLYSTQVEALKNYAVANNITFLDHWTAWPATDNIDIKNYLINGQNVPNEQGTQVWAQYLIEYFVSK
ncbi:SGNH/GDSL hydrolase family protein [Neobacillus sp. 179-C4.2 HS]|uniref:SGNH/GDSL hydrolase family protein n=1 Tax=Neobacillus driksii TaxID=3035913 RepID=A0ABV4YYU5_9BACI|nr:SGNH/GDSL hydrolase family protein [Neobacillus sp. 179.-C4.2 HS]MDP5194614.1 SGNH/GDSL hydrolase family protein [Neobacillus sp. 179.-C4.2 HS]